MPWLTHVIGRVVADSDGRSLGRVEDLMAERAGFPRADRAAVRLRAEGKRFFGTSEARVLIPWAAVRQSKRRLALDGPETASPGGASDLPLGAGLLDRQIVDTEGARVVRVNDVWLAESAGALRVVGVDVGLKGILRRLGLERLADRLAESLGYEIPERLIAWNYVAPLEEGVGGQVRLTVPGSLLRALHPSELADILDQLDPERRERILRVMTDSVLAETLAETEPGVSREVVEVLGEERVRTVLELMPPDEAADLLGVIGYETAERLLNLMGLRQASVLRELLGYPPDTAGGRMTPSFIAVPSSLNAGQAIAQIRREASQAETINYSYVLDEDGRLRGVLSLRQLLRSDPSRPVEDIIETDVVSVDLADDQEEVARIMARYDLLALPVVDQAGHLRGIVTVDDIVEVLEEEASEDLSVVTGVYLGEGPGSRVGRLAGFGLSLIAGGIAAVLLESRRAVLASIAAVAWLLPIYLRIAQDLGTWSLARALSGMNLDSRRRLDALAQELLAALASAAAAGILVAGFGTWWTGSAKAGAFLGIGIFVGSLAASLIGLSIPTFARTLRLNRILARGRPLAIAVGLASLLVYVWSLGSLDTRLP